MYIGEDLVAGKGPCLASAVQSTIESSGGRKTGDEASLDLAGIISDMEGKTVTSFSDSLKIPPVPENPAQRTDWEWIYSGQIGIKPGLYQVRAAVRDSRTGRAGSSLQWVEVPEFSLTGFTLGSIFSRETKAGGEAADSVPDMMDGTAISIGRRFAGTSRVDYFLRVYNVGRAALHVQARVYRGNRVVHETPPEPLEPRGSEDITRMVARGTLPVAKLSPGAHTLEILVTDASSNPPAIQRLRFWIR
jgi:hypothetical protein